MPWSKALVLCFASLSWLIAQPAGPAVSRESTVSSRVESVVLYRGQAVVTRALDLPATAGALELVVPDLPEAVQPQSLFAEALGEVDVRGVRFRMRSVEAAARPEVRALEERRKALVAAIAECEADLVFLNQRANRLLKLDEFTTGTAHSDLQNGRLDAEALERLIKFSTEQGRALARERLEVERRRDQARTDMALVDQELGLLSAERTKLVREAVLFIEKRDAAPSTLKLSYVVFQCGWSPSYAVRADQARKVAEIDYQAIITQATGEAWDGVQLTLSTATPSLSAAGPVLAPFTVTLRPRTDPQLRGVQPEQREELAAQFLKLAQEKQVALGNVSTATNLRDNITNVWAANDAAGRLQSLELLVTPGDVGFIGGGALEEATTGPSLNYAIDGRVSLASRQDQQMVRIARTSLAAEFAHVAIPVLSPHVHREASVTNSSGLDLLRGPVSVYLDRRFVGKAEIPDVAAGEIFTLGFGADPRLRTQREVVKRTESMQGGNRVIDVEIRMSVENFHGEAMALRVYDRLPYTNANEVLRVTPGAMSHQLSTDAVYLKEERPTGILRFDVSVPPRGTPATPFDITYTFRLEFDRNLDLSAPESGEESKNRESFERSFRFNRTR